MVNVFGKRRRTASPAGRPTTSVSSTGARRSPPARSPRPVRRPEREDRRVRHRLQPDEGTHGGRPPGARARVPSGAVDQADNLDKVAIIDLRGPDPGAFHDVYRTYAMRARLEREHGTTANQILWRGQVPLLGDANYADQSIVAVDSWLAVIEKDTRDIPLAKKIIEDKPPAQDRCIDAGHDHRRRRATRPCRPRTPRIEAGMPQADDTIKCELQPPRGVRPGRVHRRPVGRARGDVPERRVRLLEAGRRPPSDRAVAELPGRRRERRVRGAAVGTWNLDLTDHLAGPSVDRSRKFVNSVPPARAALAS